MKKSKDFSFVPDLDFNISANQKPNAQSTNENIASAPETTKSQNSTTGLENFTSAKFVPATTSKQEDSFRFQNVRTYEGYAFVFGPHHKTTDAMNALLSFNNPQDIDAERKLPSHLHNNNNEENNGNLNQSYVQLEKDFDASDVLACRTFKSKDKHGFVVAGYSATDKITLFSYHPQSKELKIIFSPSKHKLLPNDNNTYEPMKFSAEISAGSYIFALSPAINMNDDIEQIFTTKVDNPSVFNYIHSISKHSQNLAVCLKLATKQEQFQFEQSIFQNPNATNINLYLYDQVEFDLTQFKNAIIKKDTNYLPRFADKFSLQTALELINNPELQLEAPEKRFAEQVMQNYFIEKIKIDIKQEDDISKLKKFIETSNLNFANTNQLLLHAALIAKNDNSVSQAQLEIAQRYFYQAIYAKQQQARLPKTIAAWIIGIASIPTIIGPILTYALWRRAKNKEDIQQHEIKLKIPVQHQSYSKIQTLSSNQNTETQGLTTRDVLFEPLEPQFFQKQSFLNEKEEPGHLRKVTVADNKKIIFFGTKIQIEKLDKTETAKYQERNYATQFTQ